MLSPRVICQSVIDFICWVAPLGDLSQRKFKLNFTIIVIISTEEGQDPGANILAQEG